MTQVHYRRRLPFPPARLVGQYFDLEHIAHVHPRSLGEARLVSTAGSRVVWDLLSPRFLGFRLRHRVLQELVAPDRIEAEVLGGLLRGARVSTDLVADGDGTLVVERYRVPLVPGWRWLARWFEPWFHRWLDAVWEEDLRVHMCHGGWPGVPPKTQRWDGQSLRT